ncbi:2Fe-2S iron-sulfur cluster-binding protein [Rhizobium sp. SSA_523]|uniref:2Fe-2S iron-sulfur cluster-binding protein n=1 Tax=Rhizobium sp. SSA_523 TaxID=2952477 RepID=UPI002090239D|nr:2Fe-2S iron-sulfur cluster-binding protein [Rhizobium sp. SSA_523]MCO5733433.1 2Fe-2S iron-sulfur cluster-binding protein [Rhizobium sp. SSA_523]WKC21595.1 2Fe-2S iron-sulfur cluster-binding protein [Rhizobium sp. SSA_523]
MKIIFVAHDGTRTEVEASEGESVMQAAVQNGVDGVIGECGGSMMCATCHCYVDEDWIGKTGRRGEGEADMLECAASEVKATSRLSCQIEMSADLDGLVVHLPEAQI